MSAPRLSRFAAALAPFGLAAALLTAACGDDDDLPPTAGAGGPNNKAGSGGTGTGGTGTGGSAGSSGTGGSGTGGSTGAGGSAGAGGAGAGGSAGAAGSEAGGGAGGVGGQGGAGGQGGKLDPAWYECQGSDQAFVRRAYAAVLGHRPSGQAEVNYYADLVHAIDVAEGVDFAATYNPQKPRTSHAALVDVLASGREGDYLSRWTEIYLDALRVQRVDELANPGCFNQVFHPNPSALVPLVRDGDPKTALSGTQFTMLDLVRGALQADNLTAPYVGNLFAMLTRTYAGANAAPIELELSRRSDFGAWFNATYLHRDVVCLGCHNSQFSVTQTADPATNRHFPVQALFEKALFGSSLGPAPKDGYEGPTRAFAILRYDGFAGVSSAPPEGSPACVQACSAWQQSCGLYPCELLCPIINDTQWSCITQGPCNEQAFAACLTSVGGVAPWGWSGECGTFSSTVPDDIAGVDAKFGPLTGKRVTAFDTAKLLQQGFAELRQAGLVVDAGGEVQSAAMAFAYLVAMNITEQVWREVVGTPLTIPLYFPRNAAARDELRRMTDAFVAGGFSNRALLKAVVTSPAFNLAPPDEACWKAPYPAPPLFDPWTTGEPDAAKRGNGPSDSVAPLAGRAVVRTLGAALEWPNPLPSFPPSFPSDNPQLLAASELGVFLHNAEPGFRGFDFQARLSWELSFAKCDFPGSGPTTDFVDGLSLRASSTPGATARDMVAALKDRLLGDASIDEATERPALEGLLGVSLDAPVSGVDGARLRSLCGALVATPQMLLLGVPPRDGAEVPRLTPPDAAYSAYCGALDGAQVGPYLIGCAGGKASVVKPAP